MFRYNQQKTPLGPPQQIPGQWSIEIFVQQMEYYLKEQQNFNENVRKQINDLQRGQQHLQNEFVRVHASLLKAIEDKKVELFD